MNSTVSSRISRVETEINKLKIEKEALEWLESFFNVEYSFSAVCYPTYFSMNIDTRLNVYHTPTISEEEQYKYPKEFYEVDAWLLYEKLVTIFGDPIPLWYGKQGSTASVYTQDEYENLSNLESMGELKNKTPFSWLELNPYYIDSTIRNDIQGTETIFKRVDIFDPTLIFYFKTPFHFVGKHNEYDVPLRVNVTTSPKSLGIVGIRDVVKQRWVHGNPEPVYGKGRIIIEDDNRSWETRLGVGGFYRFIEPRYGVHKLSSN